MKIYSCPKCSYFGVNRTSARTHVRKHTGGKSLLKKIEITEIDDFDSAEFVCAVCPTDHQFSFKTVKSLFRHIAKSHKIAHPRSQHFRIIVANQDPSVERIFEYVHTTRNIVDKESKKPATPPVCVSSPAIEPIIKQITSHRALLRIPVMLVVDLATGTNTIEPLDDTSIMKMT